MELLFIAILLFAGTAYGEAVIELGLNDAIAHQGSDTQITCRVQNADDYIVKISKYVVTGEEENEQIYEEDVSLNTVLERRYQDTGRFEIYQISHNETFTDYILSISDLSVEDSAFYACGMAGTTSYNAKLFQVFTQPENVHFTNFSNWDLNVDVLHIEEGESANVGCVALGGVPAPRFEIMIGDWNYTRQFTQHELQNVLPRCWEESPADCLLHFSTRSEITSTNFRPGYFTDGMDMYCNAMVDESEMDPKSAKLRISMDYTPKFRCWKKHKVALHTLNYELKCTILANPQLSSARFQFHLNGRTEILNPGQETDDGEIKFLRLRRISAKETEVVLKFNEIFEKHFESKYLLVASNYHGHNTTQLELVKETPVPLVLKSDENNNPQLKSHGSMID